MSRRHWYRQKRNYVEQCCKDVQQKGSIKPHWFKDLHDIKISIGSLFIDILMLNHHWAAVSGLKVEFELDSSFIADGHIPHRWSILLQDKSRRQTRARTGLRPSEKQRRWNLLFAANIFQSLDLTARLTVSSLRLPQPEQWWRTGSHHRRKDHRWMWTELLYTHSNFSKMDKFFLLSIFVNVTFALY